MKLSGARIDGFIRQPDPAAREPGLAVTYYFGIFNLVDEIVEVAKLEEGQRGPAIPALDYKVGSGSVLTSGRADGVGADIRGLINFSQAGTYMMALQSNDGVRLELGGKLLFSDEGVHADRFSKLVPVKIETPGSKLRSAACVQNSFVPFEPSSVVRMRRSTSGSIRSSRTNSWAVRAP